MFTCLFCLFCEVAKAKAGNCGLAGSRSHVIELWLNIQIQCEAIIREVQKLGANSTQSLTDLGEPKVCSERPQEGGMDAGEISAAAHWRGDRL